MIEYDTHLHPFLSPFSFPKNKKEKSLALAATAVVEALEDGRHHNISTETFEAKALAKF
jgi:hypothetical protein